MFLFEKRALRTSLEEVNKGPPYSVRWPEADTYSRRSGCGNEGAYLQSKEHLQAKGSLGKTHVIESPSGFPGGINPAETSILDSEAFTALTCSCCLSPPGLHHCAVMALGNRDSDQAM